MVVRGGIEPPTPRFSGARYGANWPNCGELSELTVAESIVGWTDLDRGAGAVASRATPAGGIRLGGCSRWGGPPGCVSRPDQCA